MKYSTKALVYLLITLATAVQAQAADNRPQDDQAAQAATQTTPCDFSESKLPADFAVFAAGAYSGREAGGQIDQSGHEATQMDVTVNSPKKPVVLMLGAYEPTLWNVSWSKGTQVLAVVVSGYHDQVISGLDQATPTLISTYSRGPCGYFYITRDSLAPLNPIARTLFQRPVDMVYLAEEGKVVVGDPITSDTELVTAGHTTPESYRDASAPLAGQAGLDEAVRQGLIRPATPADVDAWVDALAQKLPPPDLPPIAGETPQKRDTPRLNNAYVVLKPFTYPAGLYGAHSATFFIPEGVAQPKGQPGHSAVYNFNTLRCETVVCRKF